MSSLYLHIPFCERKCIYCDFYSIEGLASMDAFLDALHLEIGRYADVGSGMKFNTIFFGGGTPSLLNPEQVSAILDCLHHAFDIAPDAEVTLETNPGTVDLPKLSGFRKAGINRLSVGIQSFHEDELLFLGRIHDAAQAKECILLARKAGFENVSIDMIYSLPGQSLERWEANLNQALALSPDHLSAYGLIVEDKTPLAKLVRAKQVSPNPPESEAALFEFTMKRMNENGYEHYEVSNYARPGYRSIHNLNYWRHGSYLGFGPSAHSFWGSPRSQLGRRWWNVASVTAYVNRIREGELPIASQEMLSDDALMTERVFLGLRSDGLDMQAFRKEFGGTLLDKHSRLIEGFVESDLACIEGEVLRVTSKGYLLCDEMSARLVS